jgi:hypothetical protein
MYVHSRWIIFCSEGFVALCFQRVRHTRKLKGFDSPVIARRVVDKGNECERVNVRFFL